MAIAYRSSSNATSLRGSSYVSSLLITAPAGVVNGDVLVAIVNASDTVTPPAGWTTVTLNGNSFYYKIAASEPGTYTWSQANPGLLAVVMAAYSGAATVTVLDINSSVTNVSSTNANATPITTANNNEMIIWGLQMSPLVTDSSVTVPSALTSRQDVSSGVSDGFNTNYAHVTLADGLLVAAGTTGTTYTNGSITLANATAIVLLALIPPLPTTFVAGLGTITLTGLAATFSQSVNFQAGLGKITLTGLAATLTQNQEFLAGLGSIKLTGLAANFPQKIAAGLIKSPTAQPFFNVPLDPPTSFVLWAWFKKLRDWVVGEGNPATSQTTAFSADNKNYYYPVNTTTGNVTITLPTAAVFSGKKYLIEKTDSSANIVTISASGTDLIDGAGSKTLTVQYAKLEIYSDGLSNWVLKVPTVGSASALNTADVSFFPNAIINGGMEVDQRGTVTTPVTLTTGALYGLDRHKVYVSAGTVTAGTITQTIAGSGTGGRTGFNLKVAGASLATTPTLTKLTHIESATAAQFANTTCSYGMIVSHDTLVPGLVYTITINKANAINNFAAVTQIATGTFISGGATPTQITLLAVAMGSCENGIQIKVDVSPGTITTKNFWYGEEMLVQGSVLPTTFPYVPFEIELARCTRYYQKSFQYAIAPAQNTGSLPGQLVYDVNAAGVGTETVYIRYIPRLRAAGTLTFYNPSAANANWRNVTAAADSGPATAVNAGQSGVGVVNTQVAGDLIGQTITVHFDVNADF